MTTETVTNRLTVAGLLAIVEQSAAVVELVNNLNPASCAPNLQRLAGELRGIAALCRETIGASHMGCAADTAILEWVADDAFNVAGKPVEEIAHVDHVYSEEEPGLHVSWCPACTDEQRRDNAARAAGEIER